MNTKIYAWANPVSPTSIVGFVDHTWVTSYAFKNGQYPTINDIPSDGKYWYCWGKYHNAGNGGIHHYPNGAIGSKEGDLKIASKLVTPNLAPPDFPGDDHDPQGGSIFYYAVDGVCHTVANQVLYITGVNGNEPLRVLEADGYHISSFFYTDYGLNSTVWNTSVQRYAPKVKVPNDNFTEHLESMGFTTENVLEVKAIRNIAQQAFISLHPKVESMNTYKVYLEVITIIYVALKAVKEAIGEGDFLRLFPSLKKFPDNKEEAGYWIDQQQLEYSMESIERVRAMRE